MLAGFNDARAFYTSISAENCIEETWKITFCKKKPWRMIVHKCIHVCVCVRVFENICCTSSLQHLLHLPRIVYYRYHGPSTSKRVASQEPLPLERNPRPPRSLTATRHVVVEFSPKRHPPWLHYIFSFKLNHWFYVVCQYVSGFCSFHSNVLRFQKSLGKQFQFE